MYHVDQQPTANSQQPTKWFLTGLAIVLCACGSSQVQAADEDHPQDLEEIAVTGNRVFWVSGWMMGSFQPPPTPYQRKWDVIEPLDGGYVPTKEEACQTLANGKPPGCSLNNFQAAPGFPSAEGTAWTGSGCGTGGLVDYIISKIMELGYDDWYSGNMERPFKNALNISLKGVCKAHDACYTTVGQKSQCDLGFHQATEGICGPLVGLVQSHCFSLTGLYQGGFGTDKSGEAYAAGQAQAMCAAWGTAMQENDCDEN